MATIYSSAFSAELQRLSDQLARLAKSRHSARYLSTLAAQLDALTLEQRLAFNYSFFEPVASKHGIDVNVDHVAPADIIAKLSALDARPPRTSKEMVDIDYLVCILACLEQVRQTPIASRFRAHVVALIRGEIELDPQLWMPLPGQTFMQSPQAMHSAPPTSSRTSRLMGQTLSHWPHSTQASCLSAMRDSDRRAVRA